MRRPIVLSVKRGTWRLNDDAAVLADGEFAQVREKRLQQDDYTCQFCDWKSQHQDVHHANDRHTDNDIENLVTACVLCHADHHIGFASRTSSGQVAGSMIWLPEISQAMLNRLLRAIFITQQIGDESQKRGAMSIWKLLAERQAPVSDAWGTSDPLRFANKLLLLPDEQYAQRELFLAPLRVLLAPHSQMVAPVLPKWIDQVKKLPSSTWGSVTDSVVERILDGRNRVREQLRRAA